MEVPLLQDILVVFALSIFVLIVCHRLKIPSVVGFLITGVLAGPGGLGLVQGLEDVEHLSHIGIILLLFTVGLEFSIRKILEAKKDFVIAGALQVLFTVLAGFVAGLMLGRPYGESLFLGFILSLSSTAIILKLLQDKGEATTPHGRAIIGILIFQDVIAIPMMLITPLLADGAGFDWGQDFLLKAIGGVILLAAVFYAALSVMPRLFDLVTKTRSRELFLLTVLVTCFSVAWGALQMGLSLSIGAFMAGLIIAESEYSNEAFGDIIPFRDIFTSFFFISIGMLCNISFVVENPLTVLLITAAILIGKASLGTLAVVIRGLPLRSAAIAGCTIAGVGEFSFVLAKSGFDSGLGTPYLYQLFLDVSLFTMALTPAVMCLSESVAKHLLKLPLPSHIKSGLDPDAPEADRHLKDHVVILGYGITGRNLARALKEAHVPFVVLEMNSETVKNERKNGAPIHFGDGTHESVLLHVGLDKARVLAVSINDPVAALRATEVARKINPSLYIITRTRRVEEMSLMSQMGASDVIPDEFGTSVEIFTRVLRLFQVTEDEIEQLVETLRSEGYKMMRGSMRHRSALNELQEGLDVVKMETQLVQEGSFLVGKTLKESDLRKSSGVSVMLIRRGAKIITEISPETVLESGDRVVILGNRDHLKIAKPFFTKSSN